MVKILQGHFGQMDHQMVILNKFTSHPGYNPVARRLKTFAIVAAISGLTYRL